MSRPVNSRYPNLEAECARKGLKRRDLMEASGLKLQSLFNKLSGRTEFLWPEVRDIRDKLFPECSMRYLFYDGHSSEQ